MRFPGFYVVRKNRNNCPLFEGDVQSVLHYILWRRFGALDNLSFLQIGASEGWMNDPIFRLARKYCWFGWAVEPLQDSFTRLQKNYAGTTVTLINAAIAEAEGPTKIYRLDGTKSPVPLPAWSHQIASLDRAHLLRFVSLIPRVEEFIVEEVVDALPLGTMLNRFGIRHVNLFQIDAEGYDYKILKMVDFDQFAPDVINLEYEHLTQEQVIEIQLILREQNYQYVVGSRDLTAFKGIRDF